jgi:nucleotide-binding universal stress UspA family protein
MYRHILIPTDGSELANKAVMLGLSQTKSIGAEITALVVETTFKCL